MKLGHKIKKLRKINADRFTVSLVFEDGFRGVADLSPLFSRTKRPLVAEILRGDMFGRCFVNAGALAWPNGYELCPDALRMMIEDSAKRAVA
jgi:hypothetical protein